jgi:predicted CoA-substrate-specific enzyme activase
MKSLVVGLDLGSVALKGILLSGDGEVLRRVQRTAAGNPSDRLAELLRQLLDGNPGPVRVGVTGGGRGVLEGVPGVVVCNDLVCAATAVRLNHPDARGVIEVGGHQSKWIRLSGSGDIESFAFNDQCAAGAGAFLEQQAGRLRMGVAEFSRIASGARQGASIAGRCSVFAKSDMIHLQQKGIPPDEIALGLCLALARNFQAVLLRGTELPQPALFCGGGALDDGLYRAFCEVFSVTPDQLRRADRPQFLSAHGAALAVLGQEGTVELAELLGPRPAVVRQGSGVSAPPLVPPVGDTLPEPEICPEGIVEAWLGVDVGSVSTDFALLGKDGEVLDGIYLPTRGNPIEVVAEGLALLKSRVGDRLRVLGVGTTGSGRHLAGKLVGADVVKNEITCQLLGARHVCPEVDTILEIGGQDSKFVSVRDGRIADFVMNKICAAGTGSFLEEQAEALGIAIRGEFSALALTSKCPVDLGSQCTVFMDTEVVNARHRGVPLPDITAGLALSVARNYMEKVAAGRTVGQNVVFQGGVASNKAVVAAFEQLLGRPVRVNPHNRISGAIGAALAAKREGEGKRSRFRGLDAVQEVSSRTFECAVCTNRCQVSRVTVGGEVAHFGDVCERYTAREGGERSPSHIPDLFGEREELFESFAGGEPITGTVGMPRASAMMEMFPFWATFFRELGFRVVLSPHTTMATLEDGVKRITAETCLPIKLTYGHVAKLLREGIDLVFLPAVLDLSDPEGTPAHMCPYVEAAGFMVSAFAREAMMVPALSLADSPDRMVDIMVRHLDYYGVSREDVADALESARRAHDGVVDRLAERGREVLSTDFGVAFVILGKPYNLHDPFLNLNLARHLRRLGILPIPMDMIPGTGVELDPQGVNLPWRYNRDTLRTLIALAADSRLFPVVVSNFGCGPDAFGLKQFDRLAQGRPSLVLEFDEHRGEAGLVTRLEAFIDEVSHHAGTQASRPVRLGSGPRLPATPSRFQGRRFVVPYFGDYAQAYVGALRLAGYEAVLLEPQDAETVACGEEASSGKECHPYIITVGDLVRNVRSGQIRSGDVFFFPGTTLPCLLHQWGRGMELALERLGVEGVEILSLGTPGHKELMDFQTLVRLWGGLVSVDLLTRSRCQVRPYAREPAEVDRIVAAAVGSVARGVEAGTLGEVLEQAGYALADVQRTGVPQLPVVGVAGDIYTRVHSFANHRLFERLEAAGLEVWPAPFLIDNVDFGLRKALVEGFYDGRYKDSATAAVAFLRKEIEGWRIRFHLGQKLLRAEEPGYRETLDLAGPYLDGRTNEILVQNVAKMVDYVRRGADGVINAISFHCMLGTISASMTERIRKDHDMIPLSTFVFSSTWGPDQDARLEAFAHQVKSFAARRRELEGTEGTYWRRLSRWWETRQ